MRTEIRCKHLLLQTEVLTMKLQLPHSHQSDFAPGSKTWCNNGQLQHIMPLTFGHLQPEGWERTFKTEIHTAYMKFMSNHFQHCKMTLSFCLITHTTTMMGVCFTWAFQSVIIIIGQKRGSPHTTMTRWNCLLNHTNLLNHNRRINLDKPELILPATEKKRA